MTWVPVPGTGVWHGRVLGQRAVPWLSGCHVLCLEASALFTDEAVSPVEILRFSSSHDSSSASQPEACV